MTRKSIYDKINNKDGAALITVLVVFLTLVVIVTTATQAALANYKRAVSSSETDSVLYIAESGLNEAYEALKEFYKESDYDEFSSAFATGFINNYAMKDNKSLNGLKVISDYGQIMNQDASSEMSFTLLSHSDSTSKFELKSKGYLGDETRTVKMSLDISHESVSTNYQPDAIVAFDFVSPNTISDIYIKYFNGPFLTNKRLSFKNIHIEYTGPLVTNNKITLEGKTDFTSGAIITNNDFIVAHNAKDDIDMLIFKPGGNIDFLITYQNSNIKNILIPNSSKGKEFRHFKFKGAESQDVANYFLGSSSNTKIAYYNPENFDPYAYPDGLGEIKSSDWIKVFGDKPNDINGIKYDYRDYFKSSFILDNMDNQELVDKYIPTVKMPDKPTFPVNLPQITEEIVNGQVFIDKNSNMVYRQHWSWAWETPAFREIDWSHLDDRKFNSIVLEGLDDPDTPLIINIGDENITIVTRKLELTNHIQVIGKGTLRIYVIGGDSSNPNKVITDQELKLNATSFTQRRSKDSSVVSEPHRIQLVVYETKQTYSNQPLTFTVPNLGGDAPVSMSVFSENLNLEVFNKFSGNFITAKGTSITFHNSSSTTQGQLIYAPNAKVNLKGGTFTGVITSKEVVSDNAGVTYQFKSDFDKSFVQEVLPEIVIPGSAGENSSVTDFKFGNMIEVNE